MIEKDQSCRDGKLLEHAECDRGRADEDSRPSLAGHKRSCATVVDKVSTTPTRDVNFHLELVSTKKGKGRPILRLKSNTASNGQFDIARREEGAGCVWIFSYISGSYLFCGITQGRDDMHAV